MKKVLVIIAVLILVLLGGFLAGPKPSTPVLASVLPSVPSDAATLTSWLREKEANTAHIKPDNEARIIWADSNQVAGEYALVYLHGFSASQEEGSAMAKEFADRYGMNLLLTRLWAHGLEEAEPLLSYDADSVYASALEALAIGKVLGKKIILMGTSTGCTLALKLAAEFPEVIVANLLYSPNIALADPTSALLIQPWGLEMAKMAIGSDYRVWEGEEYEKKYWNTRYRVEAIVNLQNLMSATMTPETFNQVKQPTLVCYYYKDEEHQDPTVSVAAMLEMLDQLGTPAEQKQAVAFPDAEAHVIANPHTSKSYNAVRTTTFGFAEEVMKLVEKPAVQAEETI